MQPVSIKRFSQLFIGSMVLGLVNSALSFDKSKALIAQDPATAAMGDSFLIITMAAGIAIPLLLWYLIAYRASNVAKWILLILTVIGLLMMPSTLASAGTMGTLWMVLAIITTLGQVVALAFLFKQDARDWLDGKGPIDPSAFN